MAPYLVSSSWTMMFSNRFLCLVLFVIGLVLSQWTDATVATVDANDDTEKLSEDEIRKAIRLKTTKQLKAIFRELNTPFDESISKQDLQQLAFDSNAMQLWLDLHPEKKPPEHEKTPPASPGDFSHVQDPVKRRALQNLQRKGISINMAGAAAMSLDALIDMDRQTSGLPPLERDL